MKKVFTISALCLTIGFVNAQSVKEADVPSSVKDAFKKKYPTTKVEKWEKENANYEAEFDNNKVETCVVYDAAGKLIETEIELAISELPQAIIDGITKIMPNKKAKETSKITDASGKVSYEAEIDNVDYIFDDKGNLLKKEEDKEKDDDED